MFDDVLWEIENECFSQGIELICGVDEVGRGPLAGPVYAAAVILPRGLRIDGLNDSKKVSPKERDRLYDIIVESALAYSVASVDEKVIDKINIANASYLAMNLAINSLSITPHLALIDGNRAVGIDREHRLVVGGDGKSASIAAASILAKVSRDRYMVELAEQYPQYNFEKHKGYPTKGHYEMLRKYGPCPIHRMTFLKKMH